MAPPLRWPHREGMTTAASAFCYASRRSSGRIEGGPNGVVLTEPSGEIELRWSSIVAVEAVRRWTGRRAVALHLADGSVVRPLALRGMRRRDALVVETSWTQFGPPGAAAMWGRPAGVIGGATIA